MIVCETNSLSTTDLLKRAVASETFKEQSERKNWSFSTKYGQCYINCQARIQYLKEVSQTDEIVVFPFISSSGMFDLSYVSLSENRFQDPRYASVSLLLLTNQYKYTGWVRKVESWILVERFKPSNTGLLPVTGCFCYSPEYRWY